APMSSRPAHEARRDRAYQAPVLAHEIMIDADESENGGHEIVPIIRDYRFRCALVVEPIIRLTGELGQLLQGVHRGLFVIVATWNIDRTKSAQSRVHNVL